MSEESSGLQPDDQKHHHDNHHRTKTNPAVTKYAHEELERDPKNLSHHDLQQTTRARRSLLCFANRHPQVRPDDAIPQNSEFLKISKHLQLRVVRINSKQRDEEFNEIMSKAMFYRDKKSLFSNSAIKNPSTVIDGGGYSNVHLLSYKSIPETYENGISTQQEDESASGAVLAVSEPVLPWAARTTHLPQNNDAILPVNSLSGLQTKQGSSEWRQVSDRSLSESNIHEKLFARVKHQHRNSVDTVSFTRSILLDVSEKSAKLSTENERVKCLSGTDKQDGDMDGDNIDGDGIDGASISTALLDHPKAFDSANHVQVQQTSPDTPKLTINTQDVPNKAMPSDMQNDELTPTISRTEQNLAVKDVVLFFIHGVAGSSDIWLNQFKYFENLGYEIVAPDLIGHGFSSAPSDDRCYDFSEIADNMLLVFDTYCKRRNVVIGHSYGASFATVIARKRQRRVNKLVLINGGGPIPLAPNPGLFSLPVCMLTCVHPVLKTMFNKQAFHEATKSFESREKAFDVPSYVLRHIMMGQTWPDGGEDYHKAISVPTLLIYGVSDQLVTLEEEIVMKETIYGSQLCLVENAGHMTMMEQPEEVNRLLMEFIGDTGRMTIQNSPVTPRRCLTRQGSSIRW